MYKTLDLNKVFKIIKNNFIMLLILPFVCLLISMIITFFFLDSKYQASTQVLVNQKEADSQVVNHDVKSDIQLVNTYSEILKSPRIISEVSNDLGKKYTSKEISNMLTISNQADSQVLNIEVVGENASDSERIANKVAEVFSDEVPSIMNVDNVSILSKSQDTAFKIAPKISVNLVGAFIVGIMISFMIIVIKELLDKRIKTEDDIIEELNIPVLGNIPKYK